MTGRWKGAIGFCSLAVALGVLPFVLGEYYLGLTTKALVLAILAMSLNLLLGHLGLASLGQAAFAGIASYAIGILTLRFEFGPWAAMGAALLAAVGAAALFGLLALRTQDIFFLVIMLAFSQVLYGLAYSLRSFTGGDDGLPGVLRPDLFPWEWANIQGTTGFYFFSAAVFLLVLAGFDLLANSPFGLSLRGIRDSESRMRVLGYNVWLYKYLAFLASALIGGMAGVLLAYLDGCPNPKDFGVIRSSTALLMVILGGPGILAGPLVGALVIVFLEAVASGFTDRWLMILGFVYVAVVLLFPEGLLGALRRAKPGAEPTASSPAQEGPPGPRQDSEAPTSTQTAQGG